MYGLNILGEWVEDSEKMKMEVKHCFENKFKETVHPYKLRF